MNLLPLEDEKRVLEVGGVWAVRKASQMNLNNTQVQRLLLVTFPTCTRMDMSRELNNIITCLPYSLSPDSLDDTQRIWSARQQKLVAEFGLQQLLGKLPKMKMVVH